jgi:hypothetical protein
MQGASSVCVKASQVAASVQLVKPASAADVRTMTVPLKVASTKEKEQKLYPRFPSTFAIPEYTWLLAETDTTQDSRVRY